MSLASASTVAVVMPCYNGARYIREALDSAIAQTHRPEAIIVVDDGSKDDSADIVREYAAKHPDHRIQLIQQANAGEPAARNAGIQAATATWVAMLDTDDWWEPRKLERQIAVANDPAPGSGGGPTCVLVHTGVIGHYPDGTHQKKAGPAKSDRVGWVTKALLEPTSIGHPSIMVRRDALQRIGGYDPSYKQACDIDLYWRLSAEGTFAFVPEYLLHYRYHAGQMSANQAEQIGYHHRAVRSFFAAHPDKEAEIGRAHIDAKLAEHVAVKLESMYWRRNLRAFRDILDYARREGLDNAAIRAWRRRSRWPDWVIRLKDRVSARSGVMEAAL